MLRSADEWQPSHIEGLDAHHDGQKWWYRCSKCAYFNDRTYHAQMHYARIHINGGREMLAKRKFLDLAVIPINSEAKPPKQPKARGKTLQTKALPAVADETKDEVVFTFGADCNSMPFRSMDLPTSSTGAMTLRLGDDAITLLNLNPAPLDGSLFEYS